MFERSVSVGIGIWRTYAIANILRPVDCILVAREMFRDGFFLVVYFILHYALRFVFNMFYTFVAIGSFEMTSRLFLLKS